jgi:hypothetical protein
LALALGWANHANLEEVVHYADELEAGLVGSPAHGGQVGAQVTVSSLAVQPGHIW